MLFNSLQYAVFLPIVFILYWLIPKKFRWSLLLVASYYFYMSWNAKYVVLIASTTLVSFYAGILIEKADSKRAKKIILWAVLLICLGILFVFKYFNFFFDSLSTIFSLFAIPLHKTTLNLLLPVGISFYTFQTLSYVIDVYRGNVIAERHLGIYATFVSFFPQLVAGPIERTSNLLPQIRNPGDFDYDNASYGMRIMIWGFFKKMVIADNLAYYVDKVYADLPKHNGFAILLSALFFAVQIYCDFSGYSDIARGSAKIFGIELMENFRSPYFSTSIKEFWSRWHISLSTWFRDYVYIPLGGNRRGKFRRYLNLLVTFLVSGLWHGANWTYVIWGGVHAFGQIIENILHLGKCEKRYTLFWWLRTAFVFLFAAFAFVFFRAESISQAAYALSHMFMGFMHPLGYVKLGLSRIGLETWWQFTKCLLPILVLAVFDFFSTKTDVIDSVGHCRPVVRYGIAFVMCFLIIALRAIGEVNFIYFQF